MAEANPDCLFVFGDNEKKFGCGGQASIRYCSNAYGIPTKKSPTMANSAFFTDSEYDKNVAHIDKAIANIPSGYDTIVFPSDGLGTGLAELPKRAPKTYAYLVSAINKRFGKLYDL